MPPDDVERLFGKVRRFELHRHYDGSGISGIGVVAQGVQFGDGTTVLRWLGSPRSTGVYEGGITDVYAIHGHSGDTAVVWLDPGLDMAEEIYSGRP